MAEQAAKALAAAGITGAPMVTTKKKGKHDQEMIKMQQGLKQNHQDVTKYVDDLSDWYKEVENKDKNKKVREAAF
jgi:hypothetical protein